MNNLKAKENLTKRSELNAFSGVLYFVFNTILALFLNPLLVNYFGSVYFGIWKSLNHFLGFASVANGGSQALKWTIAIQESSNDLNRKKREVANSIVVWFIFLPILMILVGLLTYYSPYLIKEIEPKDFNLVRTIAFMLGLNLILTPLFTVPQSVLVGVNQGYISNFVRVFWLVISGLLMFGVVFLHFDIVDLAWVTIIITFFRGIHYLITCKYRVSWFGISMPIKNEVFLFLNFSSWKLVWGLLMRFFTSSEIIFLSILVGADAVSKYVFTSYISLIGISLSAIISSAITPGLGKLIGNSEFKRSKRVIDQLRELLVAFNLLIAAGIILLNKSFISLWVGPEMFLGDEVNILIAIIMVQFVLLRNESFLIDLSLKIRKKVFTGIISTVLSVILIVLGYNYLEKNVIIIFAGIILGRIIMQIVFPIMTNRMINSSDHYFKSSKVLIITFFFLTTLIILGYNQFFNNWISLIVIGALELLFCSIFIYYFYLTELNQNLVQRKTQFMLNKLWP